MFNIHFFCIFCYVPPRLRLGLYQPIGWGFYYCKVQLVVFSCRVTRVVVWYSFMLLHSFFNTKREILLVSQINEWVYSIVESNRMWKWKVFSPGRNPVCLIYRGTLHSRYKMPHFENQPYILSKHKGREIFEHIWK